ncbi:metal binding domain of Ada-domain-containing protein [Xylariales sp. PMI_506]|nr:metal binding domain of Ada-domain-containing protein [Xylariales sp. PMI_506]
MGPSFLTDTARWNGIKSRDPVADGMFVYAVRTTKIYCRPVCKARLANRSNVSFYNTCQQAEAAGYRACKRCKPSTVGRMPEESAVRRVRAMLDKDLIIRQSTEPESTAAAEGRCTTSNSRGLAGLAKQAGLSKWHFHRVFKEVAGETPIEHLRRRQASSVAESSQGSTAAVSSTDTSAAGSFADEGLWDPFPQRIGLAESVGIGDDNLNLDQFFTDIGTMFLPEPDYWDYESDSLAEFFTYQDQT